MKILIYGINFSPELTGIGKYTGEMASFLAENGNEVKVITAVPYYPYWKVYPGYSNFWQKERHKNVTTLRAPLYLPKKITALKRILHESTFTLSSLIYFFPVLFKKIDVCIVVCPALQSGVIPSLLRYVKKFTLVVHIQDLQVDAAKQLDMVKNPWILRILEKTEKWILNRADVVSTISEGMMQKVHQKKLNHHRFLLLPNWVETEKIFPLATKDGLKENYGFKNSDFVVLYSGNIGEKQGLELVLEVAQDFLNDHRIKFFIVGNGANRSTLIEKAAKANLTNVHFGDLVPADELNSLLNMADLHLILQKPGANDVVMPSKLNGILACGGELLVVADKNCYLSNLIEHEKLGIRVDIGNTSSFSEGIRSVLEKKSSHGKNALTYAQNRLSKPAILQRFIEDLDTFKA